jgi:hypothetical protein
MIEADHSGQKKGKLMSLSPAALALLVILVFAGLLLLAIRQTRISREETARRAGRLGFEGPLETPPELIQRVEEIYRSEGNPTLEVRNVYQRIEFDRSLYIFDVIGTDDEDTTLGTEVMGVISSRLALPRFSLTTIPSFSREAGIGALMDKLMDKVLDLAAKSQDLSRFEFPEKPGFDESCILFGRDEAAARRLIDRVSWDDLTRGRNFWNFQGSGDFLAVDYGLTLSTDDKEKHLDELYRVTTELTRRLEN